MKFELFVRCLGRGFDRLSLNGYLYFNGSDQWWFGLVKFELFVMCLGRGFDRLSLNGYLYFNGSDQ